MSWSTPLTEPTSALSDPFAELGVENTEFFREALHELIEIGMSLARQLHERALTQPGKTDPSIAFERIARAVRRTIYLAHTLDDPIKAPRTQTRPSLTQQLQTALRHTPDSDDIDDIGDIDDDVEMAERLERCERLDVNDIPAGISREALFALICRDLGVSSVDDLMQRAHARADLIALGQRSDPPPGPAIQTWPTRAPHLPYAREPGRPDPPYPLRE